MGGREEREVLYLLRMGVGGVLGVEIHYKRYSVTVYTRAPH